MVCNTVLVTYASRAGSTAGVADAIGKALVESGVHVEVRPMQIVTEVDPYRAVVAGSAIRSRQWLPEALQFVRTHRATLAQRPFAVFLVCITLGMRGADKYRESVSGWLEPVRTLVRPVSEGMFAGALDLNTLPKTRETTTIRLVTSLGILPRGDHRDWDAIADWGASLADVL